MTKRDPLLTLAEAAERLGVAPGTLGNQARHGKLKATKRGRDWMVSETEAERYGREQRRTARPAVLAPEPEPPTISFGSPRPAPKPGKRR